MATGRGKSAPTTPTAKVSEGPLSAATLRRGPLGRFIRWFEQHAGPGTLTSEGVWRWGADSRNHPEAPWPPPTPDEMVPDHRFENLFTEAETFEIGDGDYQVTTHGTTHGCRGLLAFFTSGNHHSDVGGSGLEVYPSAAAWDARADDLRAHQAELDLEHEEGPRWYREQLARERESEAHEERDDRREDLIELISAASEAVREDLRAIGLHSAYAWPVPTPKLWGGFSYEIPKEEQIRSAFWAKLHDRESLVCELEWNVYEFGARRVKVIGEVDLVGFRLKKSTPPLPGPDVLLEFKRVWSLTHWNNKPDEQRAGLERDVLKLRSIISTLGSMSDPTVPSLAGIVVAGFTHTAEALGDTIEALHPDLEAFGLRRVPLSRVASPLCRAPIDNNTVYDVFVRFDLLVLEDDAP